MKLSVQTIYAFSPAITLAIFITLMSTLMSSTIAAPPPPPSNSQAFSLTATRIVPLLNPRQSSGGFLSALFSRPTARPSSEATPPPNTLSGLTNLASGIQSVPSLQSILDATGITRITDPVYNQIRRRWQQITNSDIVRRIAALRPLGSQTKRRNQM